VTYEMKTSCHRAAITLSGGLLRFIPLTSANKAQEVGHGDLRIDTILPGANKR
jgi:hypothetical protein